MGGVDTYGDGDEWMPAGVGGRCPGVEVHDSITSGPKWPPCRQTLEVETRPLNAQP